MFEKIQFLPGEVTFNDVFEPARPLAKQVDNLKEDMFQAELRNGLILDLGWYPEGNLEGAFRLVLIKDRDWENSVFSFKSRDFSAVEKEVKKIVAQLPEKS